MRAAPSGGFLDLAERDAESKLVVMNTLRSVCDPMGLPMPARRATRRKIRAAPCRSSRRPSGAMKTAPLRPFADGQVDGLGGVRGASGLVTTLLPLPVMVSVR